MFFGAAWYVRAGWRARARNKKAENARRHESWSGMRRMSHDGSGTKPGREGTYLGPESSIAIGATRMEATMNGLIYLVGLVVVIMFILSFLGLR